MIYIVKHSYSLTNKKNKLKTFVVSLVCLIDNYRCLWCLSFSFNCESSSPSSNIQMSFIKVILIVYWYGEEFFSCIDFSLVLLALIPEMKMPYPDLAGAALVCSVPPSGNRYFSTLIDDLLFFYLNITSPNWSFLSLFLVG